MAADEQQQRGPHRTYTDLRVVGDLTERDEHLTIGVIYEGAFVPLGVQPLGFIEQFKQRWNDLGGLQVDSPTDTRVQALEDRLADVERTQLAHTEQLKPAKKPPAKTTTKP